jgi:hypothetical protein
MDHNLENMILEGGGGGQKSESYELIFYVAARHTAIDCWEKRQRKGYLFVIGDELAYPTIDHTMVKRFIGDELAESVTLDQIVAEVKQRYHAYYILPGGASYGGDKQVLDFWRNLLGPQNVIELDSPEDTSECIALTIGINEGAITMQDGVEHLKKRGVLSRTIDQLTQALHLIMPHATKIGSDRARRL